MLLPFFSHSLHQKFCKRVFISKIIGFWLLVGKRKIFSYLKKHEIVQFLIENTKMLLYFIISNTKKKKKKKKKGGIPASKVLQRVFISKVIGLLLFHFDHLS